MKQPPADGSIPIFERLLSSKHEDTQYAFSHLLNIIASDSLGRSYLTENTRVIELLIQILKNEHGDTKLRKWCLGALQNLSLRKQPQNLMIKNGMIETCFTILKNEKNDLSGFSLDYFTALLMNLCLRKDGKLRCEQKAEEYLTVLKELIYIDSVQIRTFVNGILFSILTRAKIKEAAKTMNLLEDLKELREQIDERFQKQIDFIIQQTEKEQSEELDDSFEEEEDADNNFGGEDETIDDFASEPDPGGRIIFLTKDQAEEVGEDFLGEKFKASEDDESKLRNYIISCMSQVKYPVEHYQSNESYLPLNRPTTPSILAMGSLPSNNLIHQDVQERNLPSELRHRPKLPRTPIGHSRSINMSGLGIENSFAGSVELPPEKKAKVHYSLI